MIDTILMFCALVVAIQIIRYLWNWTTGILSGREERERLERENKTLTYQVKNLEAKLTLFDRIGVIPLDKNRVKFAFEDGAVVLDDLYRLVGVESKPSVRL